MPGFDGTGPWGRGPMTGRGTGYCVEYYHPEDDRFRRRRYGRGRGWSLRDIPDDIPPASPNIQPYDIEYSSEKEREYLEDVVKEMETELVEIRKRIEELDDKKTDERTEPDNGTQ